MTEEMSGIPLSVGNISIWGLDSTIVARRGRLGPPYVISYFESTSDVVFTIYIDHM